MVLSRITRLRGLLRVAAPVTAAAARQRPIVAVSRPLRRQLAVASAARFNSAPQSTAASRAANFQAAQAAAADAASVARTEESTTDTSPPVDLGAIGAASAKVLTISDVLSARESEPRDSRGLFEEWESIPGSETVHDAVALMVERDIGSLIVTEDKAGIVGIVTERDVLTKLPPRTAHVDEKLVRDIMSSHIMCIHPNTTVIDALATMTKENIRHLAVLHGELPTVVKNSSVPEEAMRCVLSITDILKAYARFEAQKKSQPSSSPSSEAKPATESTGGDAKVATSTDASAAASPATPVAGEQETAVTAATLLKKKAKRVKLILNTRAEDNVSVADAVDEMARHNFGAVLVVDKEQRVQGIFTERDYLTKVLFTQADPASVRLVDVATPAVSFLQIEDSLEKCWTQAASQDCRHFPVIGVMRKDREKELAGMLSIKDIVREISRGHETTTGFRLMDFIKARLEAKAADAKVAETKAAEAKAAEVKAAETKAAEAKAAVTEVLEGKLPMKAETVETPASTPIVAAAPSETPASSKVEPETSAAEVKKA